MKHIPQSLFGIAICALANGCVTFAPAPGADRVQLIRNPADVARCAAVGNVDWQRGHADVRNLTDSTGQLSSPQDIAPMGLANHALRTEAEERDTVNTVMRRVLGGIKV